MYFELYLYHAAPAQPPLNVEWTLIGSQLSLYWEPVVAMESESEVTGYQVSVALSVSFTAVCVSVKEWTFPVWWLARSYQAVRRHVYKVSPTLFFLPHSAVIQETQT